MRNAPAPLANIHAKSLKMLGRVNDRFVAVIMQRKMTNQYGDQSMVAKEPSLLILNHKLGRSPHSNDKTCVALLWNRHKNEYEFAQYTVGHTNVKILSMPKECRGKNRERLPNYSDFVNENIDTKQLSPAELDALVDNMEREQQKAADDELEKSSEAIEEEVENYIIAFEAKKIQHDRLHTFGPEKPSAPEAVAPTAAPEEDEDDLDEKDDLSGSYGDPPIASTAEKPEKPEKPEAEQPYEEPVRKRRGPKKAKA